MTLEPKRVIFTLNISVPSTLDQYGLGQFDRGYSIVAHEINVEELELGTQVDKHLDLVSVTHQSSFEASVYLKGTSISLRDQYRLCSQGSDVFPLPVSARETNPGWGRCG
jgi:hypothetical protein